MSPLLKASIYILFLSSVFRGHEQCLNSFHNQGQSPRYLYPQEDPGIVTAIGMASGRGRPRKDREQGLETRKEGGDPEQMRNPESVEVTRE